MNEIKHACRISLILMGSLLSIVGCTSVTPPRPTTPVVAANPSHDTFILPALDDPAQRAYLGVETTGAFPLATIRTQVLIIEAFSMYCPHCQHEAPNVNQLYRSITEDPYLRTRIKLIGIGVSNTTYEVNQFRTSFEILFPLFPDRNRNIARQLTVRQTPTFIGFVWENGTPRQFLHAAGSIGKVDEFLARVVRMAGLEDGQP